jgi:PAS domain S-box-containing protein
MNAIAPSEIVLAYRLLQQSLLAKFGLYALRTGDFDGLLQRATELCAEGMNAQFAKVLEYQPDENRLLVRAGVGWPEGVVGAATVGADLDSPAGYALKTGRSVISNHLTEESRFRTPKLLAEHGVKRAINVIIRSSELGEPFGVLEVDSISSGVFEEADLAFMQGFANLLGVAIERRKSEDALRESEERTRLIIEGARDYAVVTMTTEGVVAGWSPGAQDIFGWSEAEILGRNAAVLFTPADREAGLPAWELATAREQGCAADERWHIRKDGCPFYASGSVRPLHDAGGRLRGFVKIIKDETERGRQAEAQRAAEERWRLALDSGDIGTFDYDPVTGDLRWDARCKALFGLGPDAAVGYDTFLAGLHPDDRALVDAAVRQALAPDGAGVYDVEYRTIGLGDGVERWIAARGRVTFAGDGADRRAVRFIGTVRDVSDRKQAEAHQETMTREVSHRVKNSLALVASLLGLQARATRQDEVRRALLDAEARVGTIAEVHDQLWRRGDVTTVDLADFLGRLCANLQATAPQHRLVFEADRAIVVATDRAIPLGLLLNELVTNAFEYAYPGASGEVRVILSAPEPGQIRLEVVDRGQGLPAGFDLARLTGSLGVRLISGFVRQLGARLETSSAEPGARFVLRLSHAGAP